MQDKINKTSKFLSYILRHQPEAIGIKLDSEGWIAIDKLITHANQHNQSLTAALIKQIVSTSDKTRFMISDDQLKIRAAQGHSTKQVQINHIEKKPLEYLYHGTATRFIDSIKSQGLLARERHYVHLSSDEQTAISVGQRHGRPVVFKIKALLMSQQGLKFYLADNGVWLTKHVPSQFLIIE